MYYGSSQTSLLERSVCVCVRTGVERGGGDDGDVVDRVVLRHRDDSAGDRRLRPGGVVPSGFRRAHRPGDRRRPQLAALLPLPDRPQDRRGGPSLPAGIFAAAE